MIVVIIEIGYSVASPQAASQPRALVGSRIEEDLLHKKLILLQ